MRERVAFAPLCQHTAHNGSHIIICICGCQVQRVLMLLTATHEAQNQILHTELQTLRYSHSKQTMNLGLRTDLQRGSIAP